MIIIEKCRQGASWAGRRARWAWRHKTKLLGSAAVGVAYAQNNLAQVGKLISPRWEGAILGAFGVLAFLIGLYNQFAKPDAQDPPPPTNGST